MFNYNGNKSESDYVHLHQSTLRYLTPNTGMVNMVLSLLLSINWDLSNLCLIYSIKSETIHSFSNGSILPKQTSKATCASCLDRFQQARLYDTLKLSCAAALSNAFSCLYAHRPQRKQNKTRK